MKLIGISFLLAFTLCAKDITVAVVDTGILKSITSLRKEVFCKTGSKDFTNTSLDDNLLHGTNVSGIIHQEAKGTPYCQYIIKYTDKQLNPINNYLNALDYAIKLNPTIINLSLGAAVENRTETLLIKQALNKGIIIIAAAGNDAKELGTNYHYYPAETDPRVIVVGALDYKGLPALFSNFGPVIDYWQIGINRQGLFTNMQFSGTSQATASYTGTLIYLMNKGLVK